MGAAVTAGSGGRVFSEGFTSRTPRCLTPALVWLETGRPGDASLGLEVVVAFSSRYLRLRGTDSSLK